MKRVLLGLVFLLLSSTEGSHGIRIVPRPLVCLGSPSYNLIIAKEWTDCVGTYVSGRGNKYVGKWKNGNPDGEGTYTHAKSGNKYVGGWRYAKRNGQGTLTHTDGTKYVGKWKDDKQHGRGIFTYASGKTKEGIWKNGRFLRQSHQNLHSVLRVKNQNRY